MIGWALRQLAIWGGLGLVLYAAVADRLPIRHERGLPPVRAVAAPAPARGGAPNALVFRANRQGHVLLDAVVNGAPMRFLVDTGATRVALTLQDAAAAGLTPSDLVFNARVSTASGIARVAPVQLREIRIGQLSVADVPAVVVEHLATSLLGQSFLTRLDGYEMRDGVLTLTYW
jgi:aspartyl protease family protein